MVDFNHENKLNYVTQTEGDRVIYQTKSLAFDEMQSWIETVTAKKFSHTTDFRRSLSDGILLCNLLNCLKPGSIKRINKISTPIVGYDNIGKFLRACEDEFGLSSLILFETSDLEDLSDKSIDMTLESERRLQRVLICLFHLAKSVENRLTQTVIDPTPFGSLLQSQDHREMRRLKSNSVCAESSHDSYFSKLIQNQTPHYLANKARETLNMTKINQEIFHRSMDDEEWQERLENWKEKRRQVVSVSMSDDHRDEHYLESGEMLELKERARKMKLLRNQFKDQNILSSPPSFDPTSNGDSQLIPGIDDEMKAMIARVKEKKLAEENKRKFSISPLHTGSLSCDNEPSSSTLTGNLVEELATCLDTNGADRFNNHRDETCGDLSHCGLVYVKLTIRSKDHCDQLWGMEVASTGTGVFVSKVKIGSCADVCDIRKGDEIVSINSEDVPGRSVDYIRSIFNKYSPIATNVDSLPLVLRRKYSGDEEEELFNSDLSEVNDVRNSRISIGAHFTQDSVLLREHQTNHIMTSPGRCETLTIHMDLHQSDQEIVVADSMTAERALKFQESLAAVENCIDNREHLPMSLIQHPVHLHPDISDAVTSTSDLRRVTATVVTVQENVGLNLFWNFPKSSPNEPHFSRSTSCLGQLSDVQGALRGQLSSSGHSSVSNIYHHWETETTKSLSSNCVSRTVKSSPLVRDAIHSSMTETERSTNIEMEIAEQQLDTTNLNLQQTWRSVHSSGNSSTSGDFSALNDTVVFSLDHVDKARGSSASSPIDDTNCCLDSNDEKSTPEVPSNFRNNISTGIQADLIQTRKPTIYTNITTSFESRKKSRHACSTSQMSDDDTFSPTAFNIQDSRPDICLSVTECKESFCQNSLPISDKNELSKESTAVTGVTTHNEDPRNLWTVTSSLTEYSANDTSDNKIKEKSVEIEVTVTPQRFPLQHRNLLTKVKNEKCTDHLSNYLLTFSDVFDVEESTIQTDSVVVSALNDMAHSTRDLNGPIEYNNVPISPSKEEDSNFESIIPQLENQELQPRVKSRKKQNHLIAYAMPAESSTSISPIIIYSENRSHSLITALNTDSSMSTVPLPTLYKSESVSGNTQSMREVLTQSEDLKSKEKESIISSKKTKESGTLSESKSSSRTKEHFPDDHLTTVCVSDGTSTSNYNLPACTKYCRPTIVSQKSDATSSISTKTQCPVRNISPDRSTRHKNRGQKVPAKTPNAVFGASKTNMKCNYCSVSVGLEDLMVIEELGLHFHLRCFICSECKQPLGDGKSDTDVRIRRSKLHCMACYNKKSSRSKHRSNAQSHSTSHVIKNKAVPCGNVEPHFPPLVLPLSTTNSVVTSSTVPW